MSGSSTQETSSTDSTQAKTADENTSGIVITNEPEGVSEDRVEDPELSSDENVEEDALEEADQEETETNTGAEESIESEPEAEAEPEQSESSEPDVNSTTESIPDETKTTDNTNAVENQDETDNMTQDQTDSEVDTEKESAGSEEIHDEEPTGADPDGTVDVAGEEEETVPANPEQEEESTEEATNEDSEEESGFVEVSGAPQQFEATIESSNLSDTLKGVSVLVDECKIRTSPEGIRIRAVDPANVGMVDQTLKAIGFESLRATNGTIGVDLDRLQNVVGMANSGDLIHLDYKQETRKLHIEIEGMSYTLATIDPDSIRQEPDIPSLDLPSIVQVEEDIISRGVKAADMVSDHLSLKTEQGVQNNAFVMEAEGDTDDVDLKKTEDEDEIHQLDISSEADSLFSLDYIKSMRKAIPNGAIVTVELGEEFPVKMHFTNDEETIETTFMLAPRIQSD